MHDDKFDRTELVLILSNVLRSMKYLKDSKDALSSVMGKIADGEFSAGGERTTRNGFISQVLFELSSILDMIWQNSSCYSTEF